MKPTRTHPRTRSKWSCKGEEEDRHTRPPMKTKICVLGAGCVGLSTAVRLATAVSDRKKCATADSSPAFIGNDDTEIWVVAENFPPDSTSNIAAGIWQPYDYGGTSPELIERWSMATLDWLQGTFRTSEEAGDMGIFPCTMEVNTLGSEESLSEYYRRLPGFSELYSDPDLGQIGVSVETMILDQSHYLPWLLRQCDKLGVLRRQQRVESLQELAEEFDAVMNCCGLGARSLLGDRDVHPVRGQVVRVRAPWVKKCTVYAIGDVLYYIIPQVDCVVLGGTAQLDDWSTANSETDVAAIWHGCRRLVPSLAHAQPISEQVGLRPKRTSGVRLEAEHVPVAGGDDEGGRTLFVVHNYGHGGIGVTLHYGCVTDALHLMMDRLESTGACAAPATTTATGVIGAIPAGCTGKEEQRRRTGLLPAILLTRSLQTNAEIPP